MAEIAIFAPLLGGILALLFTSQRQFGSWIPCLSQGISFIAALTMLPNFNKTWTVDYFNWCSQLEITFGGYFDSLNIAMIVMVSLISLLVHIYSLGYMKNDVNLVKFMAYLSFFTFAMLFLVSANNLLQTFFGWEGVGLCSYLLIGFWDQKEAPNLAAIKAFLVNRVADIALILGILGIFWQTESLKLTEVLQALPDMEYAPWIALCIILGAFGKSAQFGFHVWLPDAMEGPTPVSALIHAATMVTAGVFLLVRLQPIFQSAEVLLPFIALIGGITIVFAGFVALSQYDIKRIIAYSTCSQLGYMFLAIGFKAYDAAVFHLLTHAFFKALLFLGAGAVIHGFSNEQDIRKMGGCIKQLPLTYIAMLIGSLALIGMPILSGYYSKDAILESIYRSGMPYAKLGFQLGLFGAVMTAIYSFRLLYLTFHGKNRSDEHVSAHLHEASMIFHIPLFLLALGSIVVGFVMHRLEIFTTSDEHILGVVALLPSIAMATGLSLGAIYYLVKAIPIPEKIFGFFAHHAYINELYNLVFVRGIFAFSRYCGFYGDRAINYLLPDGAASTTHYLGKAMRMLHTGYIYDYAMALTFGIVLILLVQWGIN